MRTRMLLGLCCLLLGSLAVCQDSPQNDAVPAEKPTSDQPKVKVNMLNVCTPSEEDQKEIGAALARIPKQPLFSDDFEVSRGQTTFSDKPGFVEAGGNARFSAEPTTARWVRARREFSVQALFSTVQYSFSIDPQMMVETLVLRVRDPKDLLQVAIEDNASAVTRPEAMLATDTPPSRIKLERFGKSSIVLARCSGDTATGHAAPDQSAYEPLFTKAASVVSAYRGVLGVRRIVPEELDHMSASKSSHPKAVSKPASKRSPR